MYYLSSPNLSDEYIFDSFVKFSGTVIDCVRACCPPKKSGPFAFTIWENYFNFRFFKRGKHNSCYPSYLDTLLTITRAIGFISYRFPCLEFFPNICYLCFLISLRSGFPDVWWCKVFYFCVTFCLNITKPDLECILMYSFHSLACSYVVKWH